MIETALLGVGLHGPGMVGWPDGGDVLAGRTPYDAADTPAPRPENLSPRERRRVSQAVRLALAVGQEAVGHARVDPADLPSVFGWAHGDGTTVQRILMELSTDERHVSPKDFHHSVHNVAVGYWAIATGCHRACTSVTAARDTFASALLKAMAQVHSDGDPVLLVLCDTPFPEPLNTVCPVGAPLGIGLVLAPAGTRGAKAGLTADFAAGAVEPTPPDLPALHDLWRQNAAARALPLLAGLARAEATHLTLPYGDRAHLDLALAPC
ncbi:MAG: beta-ketoacyl synthase chain length factor [Rhodovibrio sp.]|nr:beta-ketoacyl synthase chain length factor [Rhodovibrio sp.]